MKKQKVFLVGLLITLLHIPFPCLSQETSVDGGEIAIPPQAHQKAIESLQALGPARGAKVLDYRTAKILGLSSGITAKREALKTAIHDLGAKELETEIQVELSGDVLFDFNKWDIRPDAEVSLKKIGDLIKAYQSPEVIIAGHTDAKGADDYNQVLSERRASSVKNWLCEKSGIKSQRIKTLGYGESRPIAPNTHPDNSDNPEGRQKNRRVEIVIKKP